MRPLPKDILDLIDDDQAEAISKAERQHCIRRVTRRVRDRLAKLASDFHSRNLDRSRMGRGAA